MGKVSGFNLRVAFLTIRFGRLAGLAVLALGLALGLIAVAWIGVAEVEASRLTGGATGEIAEREALKQSVRDLFEHGDYAALEHLAGYFRDSGVRTPGGAWRLTVLYAGFHDIASSIGPNDAVGWRQFSAKLADWQGQFPAKPTAHIAQAIALKSYAWSVRPRTIVQQASAGGEQKFQAALANARDLLDHDKAIASADPHYYVLRADIGTALGEAPDVVMAAVSEGRAKFPAYYALDFSGLDYFAAGDGFKPIGPDEARRIEAFASTAAAAQAGADGDERYARLYWHAYAVFYGDDLFKRSAVNWPRMRAGMTAIVARYPDARNLNAFAHMACTAGDRDTTRALMAQLPERPVMTAVWQAKPVFAACRKWAGAAGATSRLQ